MRKITLALLLAALLMTTSCTLCYAENTGTQASGGISSWLSENKSDLFKHYTYKKTKRDLVVIGGSTDTQSTNGTGSAKTQKTDSTATPKNAASGAIGGVDENGIMNVPYFNQNLCYYLNGEYTHTEWAYVTFDQYGDKSIPTSGCGYCTTAMALSYFKGEIVAPVDIMNNGTYRYNTGMSRDGGVVAAEAYGIAAHTTDDADEAYQAIKDGYPVQALEGGLPWTDEGHYILCVGVAANGQVAVCDPKEELRTYCVNGTLFDWSDIAGPAKYGTGQAFTIFGC